MKSFTGAICHRLANLFVFFCGKQQDLLDLYYKQQKEHALSLSANSGQVPLLYPRDNVEKELDFPGINNYNAKAFKT